MCSRKKKKKLMNQYIQHKNLFLGGIFCKNLNNVKYIRRAKSQHKYDALGSLTSHSFSKLVYWHLILANIWHYFCDLCSGQIQEIMIYFWKFRRGHKVQKIYWFSRRKRNIWRKCLILIFFVINEWNFFFTFSFFLLFNWN